MSQYIFYFAGIIISTPIFMKLSAKNAWSKNYWDRINQKFSKSLNMVFWLMGAIVFQSAMDKLAGFFTSSPEITKLVTGISLGLALAFIPSKKNRDE